MSTYRVKPSGSQWIVTKNGGTVSNHRKKSRAKAKAKRKARTGDKVIIHRSSGTIMDRRTVR